MPVGLLLVEDDDFDVKRVTRGLSKLQDGRRVVRARDGAEALKAIAGEDGVDAIRWPYVIMLDLNMPGMNGLEFLDQLHEASPDRRPPTYVVTTSDYRVDVEEAYKRCIAGYIVKPRTSEEMVETLRSLSNLWDQFSFPSTWKGGASAGPPCA